MHAAVRRFIKEIRSEIPYKFLFKDVLEIGSRNINGSPRKYFWFCDYVGVDISKGKGVDIVSKFSKTRFDKKFDVVVSTEMLEHDDEWDLSLEKMFDLLLPGGMLLITCAAPDRQEHGTKRSTPNDSPDTTDYYRNISTDDFKRILPESLFEVYLLMYARGMNDLQFVGIKHKGGRLAFGTSYD